MKSRITLHLVTGPHHKIALVLLTAVFWWGTAANADAGHGDPASERLLFENVYFPDHPEVCSELRTGLTRLTNDAERAQYPVKVALIASESDLGEIPQLLGRPQEYAEVLQGQTGGKIGLVLIAMPGGFGLAPREPEADVLDQISIPDDADPNRLARAAVEAIPRLADAAGQSVEKPDIGSACSTDGGSSPLIYLVPAALLLLAGAAVALGRRRSSRPGQA